MSAATTHLMDGATGKMLSARIETKLSLADLLDAESEWTPWRFGMIKRLNAVGIPQDQWPEHWHWNWVHKLLAKGTLDIGGPLSPYRLMGVACADQWQV